MSILSTQNYSLYTPVVAWGICMVPHVWAFLRYDFLITSSPNADKSVALDGSSKDWKFDTAQPKSFL